MKNERTIFPFVGADSAAGTREYRNLAWWGGDDIDLTRAMGPGAVVTLELHAVMAGHNIYVPEGVHVVDDSMASMAGNDVDHAGQP